MTDSFMGGYTQALLDMAGTCNQLETDLKAHHKKFSISDFRKVIDVAINNRDRLRDSATGFIRITGDGYEWYEPKTTDRSGMYCVLARLKMTGEVLHEYTDKLYATRQQASRAAADRPAISGNPYYEFLVAPVNRFGEVDYYQLKVLEGKAEPRAEERQYLDGDFVYAGLHFRPDGKLRKVPFPEYRFRHDGEIRIWDSRGNRFFGIASRTEYTHEAFYEAAGDCEDDIFICLENGKRYVPCENELFAFEGYLTKKK